MFITPGYFMAPKLINAMINSLKQDRHDNFFIPLTPSPMMVKDIFNLTDGRIPCEVEDATLHVLKEKTRVTNSSTIEFSSGGLG